jgi:hypothetical protein
LAQKVRLAVLANWSFFCQGENTFKTLMQGLRTDRLMLPPSCVAQPNPGADMVKQAFALGYVALDHHIRNGENTVSWYRGPLVPLWYRKLETYPYLPSADAALRYNYETGFLDTSYAAAWQLGRLLALQNTHFARALYRYRNQERQKTKAAIHQTTLQAEYALTDQPVLQQVVTSVDKLGSQSQSR